MSGFSRDKCTSEELKQFKKKVIDWLNSIGINTDKIDIRAYRSYGGDVKIFTGDYMEFTNKKSSFRREKARKDAQGNIIGYEGTRGHHTRKFAQPIIINKDDYDYFVKEYYGEYKDCSDEYRKLDELKSRNVANLE